MFTVALVGRPNVGKSSLFNRLVGRRQALVWDQPGVTRDLLRAEITLDSGKSVEVWDLAGFGGDGRDLRNLGERNLEQIDVLLFVVDGSEPLVSTDHEVHQFIRKLEKPFILLVNKSDKKTFKTYGQEALRWKPAYHGTLSVERKDGLGDFFDLLESVLSSEGVSKSRLKYHQKSGVKKTIFENEKPSSSRSIFVMGRPNVGKSSLMNRLAGQSISMVGAEAGTTRDKVDTEISFRGETWTLFDTAGLRRKANIYGRHEDPVEIFSTQKVLKDLNRADAVLFLVEAEKRAHLPSQDRKLLALLKDALKPTVIVVNKWDLFRNDWTEKEYRQWLRDQLGEMAILPIVFISAKTGHHCQRVLPTLQQVLKSYREISTPQINKWLQKAIADKPPRIARRGAQGEWGRSANQYLKFAYGVQTSVKPMTFQIFCNAPRAVMEEDRKQLARSLREHFKLEGIPFKFVFRGKSKD